MRLLCEGEIVETRALPFGAALGTLPEIPNRDAWYWVWNAAPEQKIYRSLDITGSFQMPIETLASAEEPPEFLVEGQFYSGQALTVRPIEMEAEDKLLRAVSLSVDGYEGPLTVRMLTGESGELYALRQDGSREALDYRRDGRYIVFEIQNGDSFAYFKTEQQKVDIRVILLVSLSVLAIGLIVWSAHHRRKGRRPRKRKTAK